MIIRTESHVEEAAKVPLAEIAVEKGIMVLLIPVAYRRLLFDLSDDMATKIDIQFYSDARDALFKTMVE
jgi:ATP-dependent Lon protease